jgi:isopentenyl-diphosphate delta-isomerase
MSSGHRRVSDKLRHIEATLDGGSEVAAGRTDALSWSSFRFLPRALPEVDLEAIDLSTELCGKTLGAPLMVSPMTGGIERGGDLNRRMAEAAEAFRLPFGVGSQRVALEVDARAKDFKVRDVAPTTLLFANLGAIQLTKGYGPNDALRAVEMIEADALYLHLNAMQEVVQDGGDVAWSGVLRAIERVCSTLATRAPNVPVFAREVGFGLASDEARALLDAGVRGLDCAGAGGTSWTLVEGRVSEDPHHRALGEVFAPWGLTTPETILEVRRVATDVPLVASGGVRSGLHAAIAVALGATAAGMASPVLRAAAEGEEAVHAFLRTVLAELRAVLFGVGARDIRTFRERSRLFPHPSSIRLPSDRARVRT